MTAVEITGSREVARPLKVLIPLIQKDFAAAEQAGRPFEEAAGDKLVEAQYGHFDGSETKVAKWGEKTFRKSRTYIKTCIGYSSVGGAKSFKNKYNFVHADRKVGGLGWNKRVAREWTAPVDIVAERARKEGFRFAHEEELSYAEKREAKRKLAHRLIDIGYKVLAVELHPDKMGGSKEAMALLNEVRHTLKHSI